TPRPSCVRLFWHLERREASRAICTAGRSRATNTPMMAMTTSSSTSVNARGVQIAGFISMLPGANAGNQKLCQAQAIKERRSYPQDALYNSAGRHSSSFQGISSEASIAKRKKPLIFAANDAIALAGGVGQSLGVENNH